VTCHNCLIECRRFGKRGNRQRYQGHQCRKVFTDARDNTLDGMYLPVEKAELVLKLLLEGNSVSSVVRLTDVHQKTILKLLVLAGERCEKIMGRYVRNVQVRDVEMDEVWSFIGKKEKRVRPEDDQNVEGLRDAIAPGCAFQVTTDGFAPYRAAVPDTFGANVDFAMLIKVYRAVAEGERKYSPAEVASVEVVPVAGQPDP
jgi:transposase-like protein